MKTVTITKDRFAFNATVKCVDWYYCTNCEAEAIERGDNYCCNCGAKITWRLK